MYILCIMHNIPIISLSKVPKVVKLLNDLELNDIVLNIEDFKEGLNYDNIKKALSFCNIESQLKAQYYYIIFNIVY